MVSKLHEQYSSPEAHSEENEEHSVWPYADEDEQYDAEGDTEEDDRMLLRDLTEMVTNLHLNRFGTLPDFMRYDALVALSHGDLQQSMMEELGANLDMSPKAWLVREARHRIIDRRWTMLRVHEGEQANEYELLEAILERLDAQEDEISRLADLIDRVDQKLDRRRWK